MEIKGCIKKDEQPFLLDEDRAIKAFVYGVDYLRLWPGEYVPVTITVDFESSQLDKGGKGQ